LITLLPATWATAETPLIQVAASGQGFETVAKKTPFVVHGFNYDHDRAGRLIEDYWKDEWPTVAADFAEMKSLGANVVRVHLQFGKFMQNADTPDPKALKQLKRLTDLAESLGIYLDLTGLGCYHKQDVPAWYDKLNEAERWSAQANFWSAIAQQCAECDAIFCYDLMNEPVAPGGDKPSTDWLGPGFGGKHFVQRISLDRAGRDRTAIANAWINTLAGAIRRHDQRHMITVGLVHWSLDRPGLQSGFIPDKLSDQLDFLAVHLYPKTGKIDEAVATLKGFNVGKPVIIEETFTLKCNAQQLEQFFDQVQTQNCGVIGFYWGKTPAELKQSTTIADAIMLQWLELFQKMRNKE